jgi:hypothetical protein
MADSESVVRKTAAAQPHRLSTGARRVAAPQPRPSAHGAVSAGPSCASGGPEQADNAIMEDQVDVAVRGRGERTRDDLGVAWPAGNQDIGGSWAPARFLLRVERDTRSPNDSRTHLASSGQTGST